MGSGTRVSRSPRSAQTTTLCTRVPAADPLTITPCLFSGCPPFPSTYSTSNAAAKNLASFSERQYWVLLNNNEPSDDNACNSGPPDTSLPHSSPGDGIFGFAPIVDTAMGENFYRAHLVLNYNFANPCLGGIAYMSVGAHSNRGNVDSVGRNQILGALNATPGVPHTVSFVTKLYAYQRMQAALYRLVVAATWPDDQGRELPRMIQLNLFHDGNEDSSAKGPAKLRWSWPFTEDTFYPGAEIVYFDAEDAETLCSGYSVRRMSASDTCRHNLRHRPAAAIPMRGELGRVVEWNAKHSEYPHHQRRLGGRGTKQWWGVVGGSSQHAHALTKENAMNAYRFGALLLIAIFASYAHAGEQQYQDPRSVATFASTQDSAALQTIRWRVAVSCNRNPDCATRSTPAANDRNMPRSQEQVGESPSTPERRRALGLTKEPANQR